MRFGPLEMQFEGLLSPDASALTEIVKEDSRLSEGTASDDTEALLDLYSSYFSDLGYRGELGIGISGIEALEASLTPLLEIPNEAQPQAPLLAYSNLSNSLPCRTRTAQRRSISSWHLTTRGLSSTACP